MDARPTTRQTLLAKEGLASLAGLAALVLASAWWPLAPVEVGPAHGPAPAPAPWLFLGLQEILRHLPALWGGLILPGLGLGLIAALPWLAGGSGPALPTYARRPRAWEYAAWLVLLAWAALTVQGWLHSA